MLSFADVQGGGIDIRGTVQIFDGNPTPPKIVYSGFEGITGTSRLDSFSSTDGFSTMRGLGGNDLFLFGRNTDASIDFKIDGGAGIDHLNFGGSFGGVHVSLLRGKGWEGAAAGDTYTNIEMLSGSRGADTLVGDHSDNIIRGGDFEFGDGDILIGNGGNDTLIGTADFMEETTAVYNYARDLYEVEAISGRELALSYIGAGSGDGQDTTINITTYQFSDATFTRSELLDDIGFIL